MRKTVTLFAGAVVLALTLSALVDCGRKSPPSQGPLLEMTYPLSGRTVVWPNAAPVSITKTGWGETSSGWWYAANEMFLPEHGGTHVDAPIHFCDGGRTIDQIPIAEWIGPAVRIDIREKCATDRSYRLTVQDLKDWENLHGRIPAGSWVVLNTGIDSRYYPDRQGVLGTAKSGLDAIPEMSFPSYSLESAEFLVGQRNVKGLAVDTPSIDYGPSVDFEVHRAFLCADKLALENIANAEKLPPTGAVLYVIPIMIEQGTGAPARVFALLPK